MPRADVVGERCTRVPVVPADKSAFGAQAQTHEPVIADHDMLESNQPIQVDGSPAGLTDSSAPALNAGVSRALALDRVARPGTLHEQESGCTGQQVLRHRSHDLPRPLRETKADEFLECFRAPDERTEVRYARQVVPGAVPCGVLARNSPLLLRVDNRHIVAPCGVGKVQSLPGEPLVEKPETPGVAARRRIPHDGFDLDRIHHEEEALQDGKIEPLVLEGEGQVGFQCGARRMARGEKPPALLQDPVPLARSEQCPRQGNLQVAGIDQGGITGQRRPVRQPSVPKTVIGPENRCWSTPFMNSDSRLKNEVNKANSVEIHEMVRKIQFQGMFYEL